MTLAVEEKRRFKVGTLGWTADDLDDPKIERLWQQGRYEIVEGVLTEMPPAQYDASRPLVPLLTMLSNHVEKQGRGGHFAVEVDLIVSRHRVAVVDAVYVTDAEERRQAALYARKSKRKPRVRFGRLMIAPTLVIESVSQGHESHDRETKRRWYAEAGVPNYWMLDAFRRTLECLVLGDSGAYRRDVAGKAKSELRPSLFPGLVIPLGKLWE
jgi:Uma2 family endonuclease